MVEPEEIELQPQGEIALSGFDEAMARVAAKWLVGPAANKAKGDALEDGPLFGRRQADLFGGQD